ncbi:probable pectinesterase/pectinesterase inhibitor 41 [Arachis duranensis]|uniref:Pectinesterase n=2 Tax=Arachis TaxID=3817 RepID=A0A445CMJ5_ARAHY|nr:probable pectinesterase/pectinesterase inhibitor 41 [Arachis duranensis]XP_025604041.1 probable pectinesterase/pectinesterase inhibitor 41 [Arachis hypogaea]QHO45027.1 putative pectinesterase/pectinesterase inhibitor [Arachis hypogaea]RYR52139.1 hypothetical protein Ahy_A06g027058 [Arachis hypogaea]
MELSLFKNNNNTLYPLIRIYVFLFQLSLFASLSIAAYKNGAYVPTETVCNSTMYPSYCKSVLANQNGNIYDYCRVSVKKSLSQSRKFLNAVNSYLQQGGNSYSQTTIRALQDCKFLAELNLEFLSNTLDTVQKAGDVLPAGEADDYHTVLSAVLTNQQTCLGGLQTTASDQRVKDELSSLLSEDTKLNSVSLAMFVDAWIPQEQTTSWEEESHGQRGRKLLSLEDMEDVSVKDIVVVSKDGSGNFTTINEAIKAAPNNSVATDGYFVVFITEGVYEEYVSIDKKKKYLMLIGDGINRTVITGDHNVVDGFTTFNSATFAVVAEGFVAVNITFRNSAGPSKHQAVAVRNGADLSTFYGCSFEGYQDTLYTHSMRQFYRECDVYGTVDFIFGNAAVVLQNCNLYPRLPMSGQFNAITAQGRTDPNQNTGISIQNATIKAADDLAPVVGSVSTYLGRPWKEYSRTIYIQSFMDSLIAPVGWSNWNGDFALSTLYYAEYNNMGPGSSTANRVNWPGYHVINDIDAANFTVSKFLDGDAWLPPTNVPFQTSL